MPVSLGIITSSSTLMHTSLAYVSIEIQTLDAIMSYPPHRYRDSLPVLPTEILLLIRTYLFTDVTSDLVMRSYSALQRYENMLRQMLCTECLSYNEYVYGGDLWQWKDFSGACRCIEAAYLGSRQSYTVNNASSLTVMPPLNPKRFISRRQWLEHYLSCKSLRFISCNLFDQHTHSLSPPAIWCIVRHVLQHFQCVGIRDISPPLPPSDSERSEILIVPVSDAHSPGSEGMSMSSDEWDTKIKLKRVERDLGLAVPYELRSTPSSQISPLESSSVLSSTVPSVKRVLNYSEKLSRMLRAMINTIPTIYTILVTTISLPVSFLTLVLTLVCYYCKPRAFTILL
ncbi:hypothetical protein L218DRAFT_57127 [Marasmius fiardii PR-910]|nr:hypothetical protein L218DRAFT_57127 [Marasmius fiardii PR-910]